MSKNSNKNCNRNRANSSKPQNSSKPNSGTANEQRNTRDLNDSNSTKNARRAKEVTDSAIAMSKVNDVSWYTRFPQFAKDAGTLPFSQVLGQKVDMDESGSVVPYYQPGLMRIGFYPTIGVSLDNTSPINRSSVRFFTYLRSIQKAKGDYDHADLTMMIVALDSCYMFHSLMRRAYGVATLYSPINRYYPKALLAAMGFDPSIADDLSSFRTYINKFGISLGQYAIPSSIDLTARHKWMCEGIYLDSTSSKSQTYMFTPEGFWKYTNTSSVGTTLEWADWSGTGANPTLHTLEQVKAFGNALINAVSNDTDITDASGDMYALYGPNGLMRAEETPDNYTILPVYNELVLSQIENLRVIGNWATGYIPTITQNPTINNGAIIFNPLFTNSSSPSITNAATNLPAHLNFHHDSPTPDQVLEASRLCAIPNPTSLTTGQDISYGLQSCGSEVITDLTIYQFNPTTGGLRGLHTGIGFIPFNSDTTAANAQLRATVIGLMTAFDWCPGMWIGATDGTTGKLTNIFGSTWDVDNVAIVPANQIASLHEAALLSEFDIPM